MAPPSRFAAKPDAPKIPAKKAGQLLRRLLLLSRPEWNLLGVGVFFLALGSATNLVFPQAVKEIIDGALARKDTHLIDQAALAMAGVFLVQGVAFALRFYLFNLVGERVVSRVRVDLYKSLLSQEIGFFDTRRTGELTSRLASDTTVLQTSVSANISMVLRNAASAIGGVALLLYTSPRLTGLMLLTVPAVALGAVFFGGKVRRLSRASQDALAQSSEVAEESLSGIRTVRAFAAEKAEMQRYESAVERSFLLAKTRAAVGSAFIGIVAFASFGAASIVLWYGGRLVVGGSMTVGQLTSFLIYTLMVAFSLGALTDLWADFMRAAGAAERVFELLDRAPQIPLSGGKEIPHVAGKVEFRALSFAYPTRPDVTVLDRFDLSIAPGEIVALVGPSGAGKSTIASLLTRFYDPREGQVLLDGEPLAALDPSWLRRQIGVVSQEPILFSGTIAENIRYGREGATDAEVEAAARAANAHGFIEKFPDGYRTLVGERGVQLSGGQKQRVAIARAVLKDPRLLVLDEATSALDAESEHLVKEALDRLMTGRTTLVIAHRLSTVADADRVVVLDGGQVVQAGPHGDLMQVDGLYKRLVERQLSAA